MKNLAAQSHLSILTAVIDLFCYRCGILAGVEPFHPAWDFRKLRGNSYLTGALADASGYSVILKADILEPIKDDPRTYRSVGRREVAKVKPTLFVKEGGVPSHGAETIDEKTMKPNKRKARLSAVFRLHFGI